MLPIMPFSISSDVTHTGTDSSLLGDDLNSEFAQTSSLPFNELYPNDQGVVPSSNKSWGRPRQACTIPDLESSQTGKWGTTDVDLQSRKQRQRSVFIGSNPEEDTYCQPYEFLEESRKCHKETSSYLRVNVGAPSSSGQSTSFRCFEHGCDGRTFSSKGNFTRHLREKDGSAKVYLCSQCGKSFTRSTARKYHILSGRCSMGEIYQ